VRNGRREDEKGARQRRERRGGGRGRQSRLGVAKGRGWGRSKQAKIREKTARERGAHEAQEPAKQVCNNKYNKSDNDSVNI
jgi:hypothetical protein